MKYDSNSIKEILTNSGKLNNRKIHLQGMETGLDDGAVCLSGTCRLEGDHLKNLFSPVVPAIYIVGAVEDAHVVHFLYEQSRIPLLNELYQVNLVSPVVEGETVCFTSHLGRFSRDYFFSKVRLQRLNKELIGTVSGAYRLVANPKALVRGRS